VLTGASSAGWKLFFRTLLGQYDSLHHTGANAQGPCNLQNTHAVLTEAQDSLFNCMDASDAKKNSK
jgi:hypothetical protein